MIAEMISAVGETLAHSFLPHGPPVQASPHSFGPSDSSIHFFLQLAVILLTGRIVGWLARKLLGQPQVVGEMIAGVMLGPSLLGLVFPDLQNAIFPRTSKNMLYVGAQLGVALYMFLVGTTLDRHHLGSRLRAAVMVSGAGIFVPFAAAIALTPLLLAVPGLFATGIDRASATLFMGACIALTAFPMLARIINERKLASSPLGTLSLTAGAFDDACSWCVLAIVLATFSGGPGIALVAIGGSIVLAAFVFLAGPAIFAPLVERADRDGELGHGTFALVMILFCGIAFLFDAVGVHAIFGSFLLGTVIPRGKLTQELKRKLEPITVVVLLPMFFTYSGLNTRLSLINSGSLLLIAFGILAVSILAKGGGCYLAARLAGETRHTAFGIGALMNSRGLMELIVIDIGLQMGIIGPALFSILVLMAVVTTMMATPLFELSLRLGHNRF